MNITKAVVEQELTRVESNLGRMLIGGKRQILEAGATPLLSLDGMLALTVSIPGLSANDRSIEIEGTTDALLVCLARRNDTVHRDYVDGMPKIDEQMPVPTDAEAKSELISGEDSYHGKWPMPRLIAVPLEEALAEAKKLKEGN